MHWNFANVDFMNKSTSQNLAHNIKMLRGLRGLTQQALSKSSGLPRTTWAQMESGSANPTLSVLVVLASALQVSVDELIGAPRVEVQLYQAKMLPVKKRGLIQIRQLLPDAVPGFQIERMELPAGSHMSGVPHTVGTREYLTVESGQIILIASGYSWELGEGDVLVFRGDQPHSYRNAGIKKTVAYSVIALGPLNNNGVSSQ